MEPCSLVDRFGIKQDNVSTLGLWIRDVFSVFHVKLFGLFAKKSINFERIEEKNAWISKRFSLVKEISICGYNVGNENCAFFSQCVISTIYQQFPYKTSRKKTPKKADFLLKKCLLEHGIGGFAWVF